MPRKCQSCFTSFGGWVTSIACTLLLWGFMPSLVSKYPRYSNSSVQNVDFSALTFKPALQSHLSTSSSFSRWSPRLFLEMQRRSCKWACTHSRDSISSDISPWNMSGEPAMPLSNLCRSIFPKRKDEGANFGCVWIQSNGVIAHDEIKVH